MTDPESDELYDELRRKLADYGSPPSDAVWAGIRQRVPARPTPALRPRSYRRVGTLLSLLLLLTAGLVAGIYQWAKPPAGAAVATADQPAAPRQPANQPTTAIRPAPPTGQEQPAGLAATTPPAAADVSNALRAPAGHGAVAAPKTKRPALSQTRAMAFAGRRSGQLSSRIKKPARAAVGSRMGATAGGAALLPAAATATESPAALATGGLAAELQPLPVTLRLPALAAPVVAGVGRRPMPYTPPYRRLAVQLLAGPAITYRRLGLSADSATRQVEKLERPATGYTAQLGLTYALTPRLTVLAGLGYAEYATEYALTLRTTTTNYATFTRPVLVYRNASPDTLFVRDTTASRFVSQEQRQIRNRDTYHFVTVPVQVQYRVGSSDRLSYDFLLGGTLSLYTGGRTTQLLGGSDCNCQQTTWTRANSPFRVASLGLTAGAGINYRLLERWSLALQHHFTYLLTPLAADPARTNRHLFSAGLRAGVTFDLR